jgi:glycosyltransferase involved in cell wall biosynthesis
MTSTTPDTGSDIRPLHIGKFVPPPYAGVEAHVDTLLRCLQPEVRATLLAAESPVGTVAQVRLPYRVLTSRAYGKFASATLSPGVLPLARRELSSGRCNLLHIHAPNPWGDLVALSCARAVPVVMSWHSDIVRQRQLMKVYQYIQRRVLRRVDRIIVFTPRHYEGSVQLHQLDVAPKIVYVPMGIDFAGLDPTRADAAVSARLQAWAAGRPLLLTVGRHVSYKGYAHLLAAIARLRSEAVLVMVGAGVLTPALQQQARELGIAERVLFLGEVEQGALVAALHTCDVFVLPSIAPSEAFGIASAEAMACGKPTVVCELGNGVNYLNRQGETSLVVQPRDEPALADALDTLALDAGLRLRMGGAASAWVRGEFSLEAMKQGTLTVYRSLF